MRLVPPDQFLTHQSVTSSTGISTCICKSGAACSILLTHQGEASSAGISFCLSESGATWSIPDSSECQGLSRNQHMSLWDWRHQIYFWLIRVSRPQQESAHVSDLFLIYQSVTSSTGISLCESIAASSIPDSTIHSTELRLDYKPFLSHCSRNWASR